jgi:hypothetical protein
LIVRSRDMPTVCSGTGTSKIVKENKPITPIV